MERTDSEKVVKCLMPSVLVLSCHQLRRGACTVLCDGAMMSDVGIFCSCPAISGSILTEYPTLPPASDMSPQG